MYSELYVMLAYVETWIFGILVYSEPFQYCIFMHIQNAVTFAKVDELYVTNELQKPGTLTITEYSEPGHI